MLKKPGRILTQKFRKVFGKNQNQTKFAIICGGKGTRLWPLSRGSKPKQFQPLIYKKSTFQLMVSRLEKSFDSRDFFPVVSEEMVHWVTEQAPQIPKENIIIEPDQRDTLAAIGFTAAVLEKKFSNPTVISLWSDHLLKNEEEFCRSLKLASDLVADEDKIIEIDVKPTYPATHLGYIEIGEKVTQKDGFSVFEFKRQVEKPDAPTAERFLKSEKFLWHVGYSCWKTKTMLSYFARFQSEVFKILKEVQELYGQASKKELLGSYQKIPKLSIDFGILEKLTGKDQLVIAAKLGWSDIGSWDVLKDELVDKKDENAIHGEPILIDVADSLVFEAKENKLIAAIGVEDLIIVDTEEALLVCNKEDSQRVKEVVEELKKTQKTSLL
jgi:mannose-1-phosphate guanylyltransferase